MTFLTRAEVEAAVKALKAWPQHALCTYDYYKNGHW